MKLKIKHHFEAAHRLSNYTGKCRNLHGHRWEMEIELTGIKDSKTGMVVDFGRVRNLINNELDHKTLLMNNEENDQLIRSLLQTNCTVLAYDFEPTAENLAKYIGDYIISSFNSITGIKLELWESPDSSVVYEKLKRDYIHD